MVSTSADLPHEIADGESLARQCSTGNIAGGGRVKSRAFLATRYPLDLSVDRMAYRDVKGKLPPGKTAVVVQAGVVRQKIQDVKVEAKPEPDNPAHAEIALFVSRPDRIHDAALEAKALSPSLFAEVAKAAEELAALARPLE